MKSTSLIATLSLAASFVASGQVFVPAPPAEDASPEKIEPAGWLAGPDKEGTRRREAKVGGFNTSSTARIAGVAAVAGEPEVRWTYLDGGQMTRGLATPLEGPQTFLGIAASPVSAELSGQLDIPANTGLVINHIEKDSPAGKAGLQAGDVVAKLDDQILILPQQLAVLVASKKEGESVKLTYLRKGQSHQATAVLVTRSVPDSKGTFRIGGADVVIDGGANGPIRTFTKQLGMHPTLRVPSAPPAPGAADPDADTQERVRKIEAALEELKAALAK